VDYELIREVIRVFEDNGQIMPLTERLLLNTKQIEEFRRGGLYAFFQHGARLFEPTTVLYVGVSDDCHSRFVQHKSKWLGQYVSTNPTRKLFYGWIPCSDTTNKEVSIDGITWGRNKAEKVLWKEKNQLGLQLLREIIGQLN